jgi:hypothetical protein
MPPPTREDIARMREELRKDLEALDRVERLFAERTGSSNNHKSTPGLPAPPSVGLPAPPELGTPAGAAAHGLKQLCILGLKMAGPMGAPPKDILAFCKSHGYSFTSDTNGSASITTALSRLIDDDKVRREDGRYFWVGGD